MNIADALWQVWLLYWFSAAFLGALSAVFIAWGIRALYRKVRSPKFEWDRAVERYYKNEQRAKELNK